MGKIKLLIVFALLSGVVMHTSCARNAKESSEADVIAKVPVMVTGIRVKAMSEYTDLSATSVYQVKSVVKSPVSGYIDELKVNPGDAVRKGQQLFMLKTKESAAIRKDTLGLPGFSGLIPVYASLDGMITSLDHSKGDYIQEGDQLAVIAMPGSLVFILDVPVEMNSTAKPGGSCELLLPEGEKLEGRIKSILPSMNGAAQTRRLIVQPVAWRFEPEGLIARVRIITKTVAKAVTLPKSCVLSDEIMKNFWVMRLVNDSVAVKVLVTPGLHTQEEVEIATPVFPDNDRFLASGNYGLGDTARVIIRGNLK